jgi:hypothetical protein
MRHYRRNSIAVLALVLLAGCGGSSDTAGSADSSKVADKAVADVDAAMADAQRTRIAPPATPPAAQGAK